jgi:hypothetical protein
MADQNDLNEDLLDHTLAEHLRQWRKFKVAKGAIIVEIEQKVGSLKHMYAGTYDRRVLMNIGRAILDVKTGKIRLKKNGRPNSQFKKSILSTGVQLAGYAIAYNEDKKPEERIMQRVGVWVNEDSYYVHRYTDRADFVVFASALRVIAHHSRELK